MVTSSNNRNIKYLLWSMDVGVCLGEGERVLFAPLVILSFLSVFVCVRSAAANNIAGNPDFDFPLSSPCDIKRLMHQSL